MVDTTNNIMFFSDGNHPLLRPRLAVGSGEYNSEIFYTNRNQTLSEPLCIDDETL